MGGTNKREHLILSGQKILWEYGYDRSSVNDITIEAGLPKGSFYHYFDSKEKFALEAMNHFVENNLEILEGKKSTVKAIETLIDERIEAVVNLNFTKESYTSMMSHAYSTQNSQFRDQLLAAIDKSNEAMLELLTELKKSGKINAKLKISELVEFIDFSWRGARLKSRILKSKEPLDIFKKYLVAFILKS